MERETKGKDEEAKKLMNENNGRGRLNKQMNVRKNEPRNKRTNEQKVVRGGERRTERVNEQESEQANERMNWDERTNECRRTR